MKKVKSVGLALGGVAMLAMVAGGGVALAKAQAPAAAKSNPYFANVEWDDDIDDLRVPRTAMPIPNQAALQRAGMVKVKQVERDDDHLEVEGYDRQGREIEVKMDLSGQRVLQVEVDHDDDDRRIFRR